MAKTLILVRHGKAASARPGEPDEARTLTAAGRAALDAPSGFAQSFSLLSADEAAAAELWASPAVRAQETAEAIVRATGAPAPVAHRSLWEQDDAAFLDEVAAADAETVIAVGHIPFMERMVEHLTGADVAMKPGAVAAVELADDLKPGASRLLWFVQGPRV